MLGLRMGAEQTLRFETFDDEVPEAVFTDTDRNGRNSPHEFQEAITKFHARRESFSHFFYSYLSTVLSNCRPTSNQPNTVLKWMKTYSKEMDSDLK